MTYDLETIQQTLFRVLGKNIPLPKLKAELEKEMWLPEVDRMIAVANVDNELAASNKYGLFIRMTKRGEYLISTGRFRYARLLTPEEIAKCF
jgi:hypothetical protein